MEPPCSRIRGTLIVPTLISQIGLTGAIDFNVDDHHSQKVKKYTSGDGIKILPSAELYKRMPV